MRDNNQFEAFNERDYITVLKVFATISIVAAHSGYLSTNANVFNNMFSWILSQIGSIGVGIFFIISGYLFGKKRYTIKGFFKRKVVTIILPWVFTGTFVYFYVALRKGGISISAWMGFIVGTSYHLYFLTVLMLFYILFFVIKDNRWFINCFIVVGVVSILLTANGNLGILNPYLNIFNFIAYFSVGFLFAKKNCFASFALMCSRKKYIFLIIYLLELILIKTFHVSSGYFGYATIIIQPIAVMMIFGFGTNNILYKKIIMLIGKYSFSIYLLHLPVAGIVIFFFNKFDLWLLTLFRPLIIILLTGILIIGYMKVIRKMSLSDAYLQMIGLR